MRAEGVLEYFMGIAHWFDGRKAVAGLIIAGTLGFAGCAPPAPASIVKLPVTGAAQGAETFQVTEYALIEQSTDNPTHAGFQERVPPSVAARRSALPFLSPEQAVAAPNKALEPFGYRLAANPNPPFGAYALYQDGALLQSDIARFWPVSLKQNGSSRNAPASDFVLAFVTLNGEHRMASLDGVRQWPGPSEASTPPVYMGDQLVYAFVDGGAGILADSGSTPAAGGGLTVIAGEDILYYAGASPAPRNLYTWVNHWAVELDNRVIVDGQDLRERYGYQEIFHWSMVEGRPFYFFTQNGLTHLNYDGRDLPYTYDQVVHGNQGETAIFNPGSSDRMVWFYALRDGLWYYVEAGMLE